MDFIVENSTWIIIFVVILVMTLIGYIADKSNFIANRKEKEKNKKVQVDNEKKNMKTKEQQEFAAEIGDGSDLIMKENNIVYPIELDRPEWKIEIPVQESSNEQELPENFNDGMDFPMDLSVEENSNNLNEMEKEISQNDFEKKNSENVNNNYDINTPLQNGVLNLDLYDKEVKSDNENLENINEVVSNENDNSIKEDKNSDNIDMPLPEIDSLKEVNDEDIWKF